jgi:hypothetical protein
MQRQAKIPPILTGQTAFFDPGVANLLPARITIMHTVFGRDDTHTCKHCQHFTRFRSGSGHKTWAKCAKTKDSGGPGSDWKAGWTACGEFVEARD